MNLDNIDKALEKYNEGNPIARWVRKKTPPGYFNRWILIGGILITIGMLMAWYSLAAEPYVSCEDRAGCIHPSTGELLPDGYEDGTPLKQQVKQGLFVGFLGLLITLSLNHLIYRRTLK